MILVIWDILNIIKHYPIKTDKEVCLIPSFQIEYISIFVQIYKNKEENYKTRQIFRVDMSEVDFS